ncbi:hybrid sensor histidine kinase/response regulator transcription factor [Flammeovirga aprica]|uniref:histidine kinase n=1 Tax=Flammeovirga aprica JL-4 TaxID=694437 RepID=A0A7X9S0V0_9BACT|nr:hybrid sensor histidine kinase/response regulator transcription factor [Flammeovirga aprica]NME72362.1 response regulator [Flammeovirga aprica JL-4]
MTIRASIIISILFCIGNFAFGQFSTKQYTVNDGLSINEVTDLYVDQQMHYLWICTNNGLNRFDGHRFETKYIERKEGRVSHFINALAEDQSHHFWVGTNRGLALYDYKNDLWKTLDKGLESGIYTQLSLLNDSLLYGVRDNDELIEINTKTQEHKVIETNLIESIFQLESVHGTLYLGGWKGLYSYDPVRQEFKQEAKGKIKNASLIKYLKDETFWVKDNGKLLYIPVVNKKPKYSNIIDVSPLLKKKKNEKSQVLDVAVLQDQYLISVNSKLKSIKKSDLTKKKVGVSRWVSTLEAVKICVDQYQNVWCSTWKEGFNQLQKSTKPFKSVAFNPHLKGVQPLRHVRGFAEIDSSQILVGTEQNGFFIYDREQRNIQPYPTKTPFITIENKVLNMTKDWNGRVWTGHLQIGTRVFLGEGKEEINQQFRFRNRRKQYMAVNDFLVDATQKKIYMVGASSVYQYDDQKKDFTSKRIDGRQLDCIERDKSTGNFWLGSGQGLQVYDVTLKNKLADYHKLIENAGLEDIRINTLFFDQEGVLWIGTYGDGLFYYKKENKAIIPVSLPEYLDVKVVYACIDDQEQTTLWVSTNSGLIAYHKPTKTFKKYTAEDGVLDNQFCYRSAFRAEDGTLFFGEANGFTFFHPDDLKRKKNTLPSPQFSEFFIGPQKTPLYGEEENSITITDNSFSFHFFTPELSNSESYTYAYQLEGFDKEFRYSHLSDPKASYHHLPSGRYRFKVKVTRPFSDWSQETFSPWLVIPLPWYQTPTAILGFTLLFLFVFILSIWIIKEQLQLKNTAVIARMEQQNTEEISRTKLRFFTDITHEIRTPLTLILSPLNTILENRQFDLPTQKSLMTIQKSAKRLSSLVDELLLFRKTENNNLNLKLEEIAVHDLLESICDWFNYEAETKNITLKYQFSETAIHAVMDRDMIEKVLANLISNALKFTEDGGEISITCDQQNGATIIKVKDNGKGMNEEEVERIFHRFYESNPSEHAGFGIGLELSQRIVLAHQGKISVESQMGQGSTFSIEIPQLQPNTEAFQKKEWSKEKAVFPEAHNGRVIPSLLDGKLLIVEDDTEIRNYIADLFKVQFSVTCMKNGQEGLFYAQSNPVDLVISDYQMPLMNGVEMCHHLKSDLTTSHIPVIMLSAFNEIEDQLRGLEVGADDYIEKPFESKILYYKITNLLNTRQQLKKNFNQGQPLDLSSLPQQDQRFLKLLNTVIHQEIQNENLSVDFVAEKMKVSRTTLNSKLKGLLNVTASEYIRKEKLKEAYRLLIEEDYNVTEAADAVGFSYAYFNTLFKKEFGVPPGKL